VIAGLAGGRRERIEHVLDTQRRSRRQIELLRLHRGTTRVPA
jgi:hypothetical protein